MSILIMKFGGVSLSNISKILKIAKIIIMLIMIEKGALIGLRGKKAKHCPVFEQTQV